jgi:hypothetical protein
MLRAVMPGKQVFVGNHYHLNIGCYQYEWTVLKTGLADIDIDDL